jgi:phosphohistidine phosphatase SixA
MTTRARSALLGACLLVAAAALAQPSREELVSALRQGGHVIVMRHASSPRTPPEVADAHPDNTARERQLDAAGRDTAAAMGAALRKLRIPIGEVLSSPTFRAAETVRYLAIEEAVLVPELGDGGDSMQPDREGVRSRWLAERAGRLPPAGTNILVVTHLPNLAGAFGEQASDMGDGEALIIRPKGGVANIVGRVPIAEWPLLIGG